MKPLIKSLTIFLLVVASFLSCSKKSDTQPNNQNNTGTVTGNGITISINVQTELNRVGKTAQATAVVKDGSGNVLPNKTVSWSITDNNPISVSSTGLVTALKAGTSKLRASVDNVTAETTITVGANQTAVSTSLGCLCDVTDHLGVTNVTFTAPIMKAEDLSIIYPLGYMWKGHVTPIDHQYYYPLNPLATPVQEYPVYSPAAGYIVKVGRTPLTQTEVGVSPRDNYDIMIQHSCNTYTYLSLITSLTPEMQTAIGTLERGASKAVYIKVTAGQQVARVGGQSLDVNVFDANAPAKKWIVPGHYTEIGKIYVSDPFLFYSPTVKAALMAKNPRVAEPRGGVVDYDIDGKLVGTWFLQGTNGYMGTPGLGNDYWRGHLVFAYHTFDPNAIEISIGRWNKPGASENDVKAGWQFSVKGNTPDPKNVSTATGMVKYELADLTYSIAGGVPWDRQTYQGPITIGAATAVEGVLLVQMTGDRLIKVEAFPGKTAAQVTGFTAAAQMYER